MLKNLLAWILSVFMATICTNRPWQPPIVMGRLLRPPPVRRVAVPLRHGTWVFWRWERTARLT